MEELIQIKLRSLKNKGIEPSKVESIIHRYRNLNKDIFSSQQVLRDKDKYSNTDKRKIVNKCCELLKCKEEIHEIVQDTIWVEDLFYVLNNGNKRRSTELSNIIKKLEYTKPS